MITNEDAFQARVMRENLWKRHVSSDYQTKWYVKVTHIGERQTISEIDLIVIEGCERAYAYEFKFLNGRYASYNYKRVYQGLGQTLLYFWYGFDQCTLCIGVSENLDISTHRKIEAKICQATQAVEKIRKSMPYLGWMVLFEEKNHLKTYRFLAPEGSYPVVTKPMQKDRETILAGNVKTRGKPFLKRHGLILSNVQSLPDS
jgi:hypothetical protein